MNQTEREILSHLIVAVGKTLEALSMGAGIDTFVHLNHTYVEIMQPLVDRLEIPGD